MSLLLDIMTHFYLSLCSDLWQKFLDDCLMHLDLEVQVQCVFCGKGLSFESLEVDNSIQVLSELEICLIF